MARSRFIQDRKHRDFLDRVHGETHGPVSGRTKCYVLGCQRNSGDASKGLLGRFCKTHLHAHRRHGHPTKRSYLAKETNPYRRAALVWLNENPADDYAKAAVKRITGLYSRAGQPIAPNSTRLLSAKERAANIWARLRVAQVDATLMVAAIVGVALRFEDDAEKPKGAWGQEYLRVQIAKVLHRHAGGFKKQWPARKVMHRSGVKARPAPVTLEMHNDSAGPALRVLGQQAEMFVSGLLKSMAIPSGKS